MITPFTITHWNGRSEKLESEEAVVNSLEELTTTELALARVECKSNCGNFTIGEIFASDFLLMHEWNGWVAFANTDTHIAKAVEKMNREEAFGE